MSSRDHLPLLPPHFGKTSVQIKRWLYIGCLYIILGITPLVTAQTRKLRIVSVHMDTNDKFPKAIQFFCGEQYNPKDCNQHVLSLRRVLAHYPIEQLGTWSFVLVPSADWKDLVRGTKNPSAPALTELERRTTVFEEVLFSSKPSPTRVAELLHMFNIPADALVELAVSHELGHALCHDKDEGRTKILSFKLRAGQPLVCHPSRGASKSPAETNWLSGIGGPVGPN